MTITNRQSGTNVHEVSDGIFRINTPVDIAGGFSFNQYLIMDDEPLLFHAGLRKMFPLVYEAVESIISVKDLRYIAFAHFEADECGSLNEWLGRLPRRRQFVAKWLLWYRLTMLPIVQRLPWPKEIRLVLESIKSDGLMRRTCLTVGIMVS